MSSRRLRFDKVALRFVDDLRTALQGVVPDGTTLAITITAPIRQGSATAADLEGELRNRLSRGGSALALDATIRANRIRARLIGKRSLRQPSVIGFVHNPDVDAACLLLAAEAVLAGRAAVDDAYARAVESALNRAPAT